MKSYKIILTLITIMLSFAFFGCNNNDVKDETKEEEEKAATYVTVKPVKYETTNVETDMVKFYNETKNSDGSSWDNPLDYGFVPGVWHTVTVNGLDCPVYSTRCGYNIHSFAYINVDTDGTFSLEVTVDTKNITFCKTKILPEKRNCKTKINDTKVTFTVTELTDYTLCFGDPTIAPDYALTLFFAPYTKNENKENLNYVEVSPGTYDDNDETETPALPLTTSNSYYYFKKGFYSLNSLYIPDNSIVYFEPGTYLEYRQDDNKACFHNLGKTFTILGNAIVDMSKCMGGDSKTKGAYDFTGATSGYVEGLVNINSHTWTMCFTDCDNIEVKHCMLFGYRTYSDGIMLAGCTDSLVHYNFVRTGDDAIEAKATSNRIIEGKNNLVYEYNSVWTDKANAYGVIYENNADIDGITFRYNSVGFAQSAWSQHLGCFTIQLGVNYEHVWQNIHFEDSEVYYTSNQLMNIYNVTYTIFSYGVAGETYGGAIKNIYFKNLTCARSVQTNVDTHALSVIYRSRTEEEAEERLVLGKIYIDNVTYLGKEITKESLSDESLVLIEVNPGVTWNTNNIKFNTLTEKE